MSSIQSDMLRVPGAGLAYTLQGSGPLLLLIAGGGGLGGGFQGVADYLADWYKVVTYDRRGIGQSALEHPTENVSLEMQSDDAHYLLAHLSAEAAYVFGSSAGALIGLDLVTRYAGQVRVLVAHEPPAVYLLPGPDPAIESLQEGVQHEGHLRPCASLRHRSA